MAEPVQCTAARCDEGPCRIPSRWIVAADVEVPPECPNRVFLPDAASQLRPLVNDIEFHMTPRADVLVSPAPVGGRPSYVATLIAEGRLTLLESRVPVKVRGGVAPIKPPDDEPDEPPPPGPTQTSWIKLRVVDDATGEPVAGVALQVKLPSGQERKFSTRPDGMIDIQDIDPGTVDVWSDTTGATVEDACDFVVAGEAPSGTPATDRTEKARGARLIEIDEHRVATGETTESVAAANNLTWQELAQFNWQTQDPEELAEHQREDLGCTRRAASGIGCEFDSGDNPGVLFVPKKWEQRGLATEQTHTFRARSLTYKPAMIECVCIPGVTFEFDKSFLRPTVVDKMKEIDAELTKFPDAKLMIWGHTDRVGNDQYNKDLSDRRARSTFAFITDNADIWEELYNQENWGLATVQTVLKDLGHDPGEIDGVMGPNTQAAMRSFLGVPDGTPVNNDATFRKKLFKAYMTGKHDVRVTEGQFADPKFMGCGEFNPFLAPNANELANRNPGNEPNRRVVVYLFRNPPQNIPCKLHDIGPCKLEIAKNPGARADRSPNPPFPCAFYDGIATKCHCEGGKAAPPPPAPKATLEIVTSTTLGADAASPVATFVRFGIWDNAYDAAGNVQNAAAEGSNFVGSDKRRFYFRVKDPGATANEVTIKWKTLKTDGSDDDAPATQTLTLLETSAGSKIFVSRAVMLCTDDTDRNQPTDSGLPAAHANAGPRNAGESDHRTRRASMEGFVQGEYTPSSGAAKATVKLPVFNRNPEERRRLSVRVINYSIGGVASVNEDYINGQFAHANSRWNQVGLKIERAATVARACPAAALNAANLYSGSANNAQEQAALSDLIPVTPDGTLTVVFVNMTGSNAYATIAQRNPIPQPDGSQLTLGDRYFIFINSGLNLDGDTLAHEHHHVLFNRFDTATPRQFYTFNTSPSNSFGLPLPDVRVRRRIQNQHAADPDNDAANNNVLNWHRRQRSVRFPIPGGIAAPDNTTGNRLSTAF